MKLNKKLLCAFLKMVLLVSTAMMAMVPIVNIASTSPGTQFFVDPPEVRNVASGSNFLAKVNVTESPLTYAWEIFFSWDPNLLNLTYIKQGDFLHRWYWDEWDEEWYPLYPTSFLLEPSSLDEANLNGQIKVGCSLVGAVPWASGDGWLCSLGFTVKAQGSCILNLFDTCLGDYILTGSPAYTYYPNLDCFFFNEPFHDIELDNVVPDVLKVRGGDPVTIEVTVSNKGNYTETSETFNITVYADTIAYEYTYDALGRLIRTTIAIGDEITIGTQTLTEPLPPDATTILTFTWDTGGVAWGNYTISAEVKGDDDTRDNIFIDGKVSVVPLQDVAVTNVTTNTTSAKIGEIVSVNVTVANQGYENETFDVTAYYSDVPIDTQTVTSLPPNNQTSLLFIWNTTFATAGVHTIKARTALDADMNATNDEFINGDVTVNREAGWPIANFTHSPQKPIVNEEITFTSTSYDEDGYIESWKWDFNNDGNIDATTEIATWSYTEAGHYKVRLLVDDNDTLTPPCGIEKIITIYALPVASFTHSPTSPLINEIVAFNASASYDPDGTIVDYSWEFGDDQTGSGMTVSHAYTSFGQWTVKLTVTDNDGFKGTKSLMLNVIKGPVASFSFTPASPVVNETVAFDATSSTPNGGSLTGYSWKFGDGNLADETDPLTSHAYTQAGTYTVNLTVIDSEGLTHTTTQIITVGKLSSAITINISSQSVKLGEKATISGAITPVRSAVTVSVLYRLSGDLTWDSLGTAQTNANGQYSFDWTPTTSGSYEAKTSWTGDANTQGAESETTTVNVQEVPPTSDILPYIVAGIAIIIVVAVVLYVVKFRKK